MTLVPKTASSGFALDRVYFGEQVLRIVPPDDPSLRDEEEINFAWDWRLQGEDAFEIFLKLSLSPTRMRPEEIRATACGVFRIAGVQPALGIKAFARLNGPTILMPYVRECITAMTSRSFYGAHILSPINMVELMKTQDAEAATGSRQIAAREVSSEPIGLPGSGDAVEMGSPDSNPDDVRAK